MIDQFVSSTPNLHAPSEQQVHATQKQTQPHGLTGSEVEGLALRIHIRRLWGKERRLGRYSPVDELCLDLARLDVQALASLRLTILTRLYEVLAAERASA